MATRKPVMAEWKPIMATRKPAMADWKPILAKLQQPFFQTLL